MGEPKYPGAAIAIRATPQENAIAILSRAQRELRAAGCPRAEIDRFRRQAMSGTYQQLLNTVREWVTVL